MATIQDVAKHAHVGVGTVSRVLSGKGYVKAETREKIMQSIKALNYVPNEMARNLFYQKSGIVAVIVPRVSHPFFAEFVNEAEAALCKEGYQTMICNTWSECNYELRYLDMLQRRVVDGIIFGSHTLDVEHYQKIQRPVVALDRDLGPNIPCVSVDHEEGGRMAAEALIEAGCRCVLQFRGNGSVSSPSNRRHEVFERIMQEHGITCHNYIMEWNSLGYEYFESITEHILERYPDVDGVFAVDPIAMNLIRRAAESGKKVPQDLKVVAYDGSAVARLASPSLTVVCQPIAQLAQESVRLVLDLIQGKTTDQHVELHVSLRHGRSTMKTSER
jgi:LacI family sucrose operon transcriptional repressor